MRSADLLTEFRAPIRERGADYHRGRTVLLGACTATSVRARARGKWEYSVRIEVIDQTLTLECTCPYFLTWKRPCKHLWATVLLAEERGVLAPLPGWTEVAHDNSGEGDPDEDQADTLTVVSRGGAEFLPRVGRIKEPAPPPRAAWQSLLAEARRVTRPDEPAPAAPPPTLIYVVDLEKMRSSGDLVLSLRTRSRKKDGQWSKDKPASVPYRSLELVGDPQDRRALTLYQAAAAIGQETSTHYYGFGYGRRTFATEAAIAPALGDELLGLLSAGGRLFVREIHDGPLSPALYQPDPPWDFVLRLVRHESAAGSEIRGGLRRGEESVDLAEPLLLSSEGWVVFRGRLGRLRHFGAYALLAALRQQRTIALPATDEPAFVTSLYGLPVVPRLELPDDLAFQELAVVPDRVLKVGAPVERRWGEPSNRLSGLVIFSYDGLSVAHGDEREAIADPQTRRLLRRDRAAEAEAVRQLEELGFRSLDGRGSYQDADNHKFDIAPARLPGAVRALVGAGWRVEAEGRFYRRPRSFQLSVSSGVDWFDLEARIDFDGVSVALPRLLRALRRGEKTIVLDDGSIGMLPEDWLQRYGLLGEVGTPEGDRLRFQPAQVGLLDALLAAEPEVSVDALFTRARDQLSGFERIEPEPAPRGFRGQLRPYQELGLGWMSFLRRFGFGGCLADDMGLGKTVQVLAMLATRAAATKAAKAAKKPSLVVVPKSLVWNWQQEAARFAPHLRVLAHVGSDRAGDAAALRPAVQNADLVLTTYGYLRKDAAFLREIEMDYVILDEAQAIKNADSESAKAARLLRGDHRLVLSGTPIENHIGELWSLIDFLNPGMLGAARVFSGAAGNRRPDREALAVLARALRPFILRRTKEQVAPELPAKHQETILCEMEPDQRRLYEELRAHYRSKLLGKIATEGLAKAKIQVLEALLRLRQAACHPALIDAKRAGDGSAKLEVLFARLEEVLREGHKALVFSQFTSFLALVRARLDAAGIPYQYLDGKTTDRQACVSRFQEDPGCGLFLISLKAGGVGLNLTAADYVFILDPWWNPAVEAQAVDRAHRIGQDKHVFVYRLLCRDSVEEKVAALQEQKRDLAAAIIDADGSLLQNLDRETLELLLG